MEMVEKNDRMLGQFPTHLTDLYPVHILQLCPQETVGNSFEHFVEG